MSLEQRLLKIAPRWAWATAYALQLAIALVFWLYSRPAAWEGDVLRGWPLAYGQDQSDVIGDEFGPFMAHFQLGRFVVDTALALLFGLTAGAAVLLVSRRLRRVAA